MKHTDAELRSLVGRATPLSKRSQSCIERCGGESEALGRLQRWQSAFCLEGDASILTRRLAFDGLDSDMCLPLLGSVRLAGDQPIPAWAQRLETMLQRYPSPEQAVQDNWILPFADWAQQSLPFRDVWVPFVSGVTEE